MGEMTLADIAAVTDRDNNAFGGNNGGMWIFALLILLRWAEATGTEETRTAEANR